MKYAEKRAKQREAAITTRATIADTAAQLGAKSTFVDFAAAGDGNFLYLDFHTGDLLLGYKVEGEVEKIIVIRSDDPNIDENFFVYVQELSDLAEHGMRYQPRANRDDWVENQRAEVYDALLQVIDDEGGHQAVVKAIKAIAAADAIRADIADGSLNSDVMRLFDPKRIQFFGTVSGDKPIVLKAGFFETGTRKSFCISIEAAPLGLPQEELQVGAFVPVTQLFNENIANHKAALLASFILGLVPEDKKEEVRAIVDVFIDADAKSSVNQHKHHNARPVDQHGYLRRKHRDEGNGHLTVH